MNTVLTRPRLAIVGSGISGLTAAYFLQNEFEITIFESESWIGGHTHTVEVRDESKSVCVDTGFIVFNHWTYPRFIKLLTELGVPYQPSDMSFSLSCERTGLEYNGTSINALFAQRKNLFSGKFWSLLLDIVRFNGKARTLARAADSSLTMQEWLAHERFSEHLVDYYLLPLGRSIWSASRSQMLKFPAQFYARFFEKHGFLNLIDRPIWQTVQGGSQEYVKALVQKLKATIQTTCPVIQIERTAHQAIITTKNQQHHSFDAVVIATHSDTALQLLANPSDAERQILKCFPYEDNHVVLHSDTSILPKTPLARGAWNYHLLTDRDGPSTLTYDMNKLQNLQTSTPFLVTLNHTSAIDPNLIHAEYNYAHPQYTPAGVEAQARHHEISGVQNTFYCGAYWGNGFHEDGVVSGLTVVDQAKQWKKIHAQRIV